LFGRNYDVYYRFREHTESYLTKPSNGHSSVGNTDIFVGREDGVNDNDLAIAMAMVRPIEVRPGINFALLVRCILDKCANVREATKLLTSAHHVSAYNYLIADREGNMAVVEACSRRVIVRRPEEAARFIVCTNQFIHADMQDMENHRERPTDSDLRYKIIYEQLQHLNGKVKVNDAKKILSSHDGQVCLHIEEIQLGTLWSVIATLKKSSIYMAEGHPCKARYRLDYRLTKNTAENL
jgi:predicted choloylglycine hydrolase